MGKKPKPSIISIQAEGTTADKNLVRNEIRKEAQKLAAQMPTFGPDRLIYVRNLLEQTLQNKLDKEVFKTFIRMTNSYLELQQAAPRAKLLERR